MQLRLATEIEPTQPHYWQLYAYIKMRYAVSTNKLLPMCKLKIDVYKQAEQALLKSVELRQTWPE